MVTSWLRGEAQDGTDVFLARAATAPVLEALPIYRGGEPPAPRHRRGRTPCNPPKRGSVPLCGGSPQVSVFVDSGEALVTGQRRLVCARCANEWVYPRMTCVACGETEGIKLVVLADPEQLPHLRVDACERCKRYIVSVDARLEGTRGRGRRRDRRDPSRHHCGRAWLHEGHAQPDGVLMAAFEERPVGFFTDTSICIGCKACEVACKEWNQLEGNEPQPAPRQLRQHRTARRARTGATCNSSSTCRTPATPMATAHSCRRRHRSRAARPG